MNYQDKKEFIRLRKIKNKTAEQEKLFDYLKKLLYTSIKNKK